MKTKLITQLKSFLFFSLSKLSTEVYSSSKPDV